MDSFAHQTLLPRKALHTSNGQLLCSGNGKPGTAYGARPQCNKSCLETFPKLACQCMFRSLLPDHQVNHAWRARHSTTSMPPAFIHASKPLALHEGMDHQDDSDSANLLTHCSLCWPVLLICAKSGCPQSEKHCPCAPQ